MALEIYTPNRRRDITRPEATTQPARGESTGTSAFAVLARTDKDRRAPCFPVVRPTGECRVGAQARESVDLRESDRARARFS